MHLRVGRWSGSPFYLHCHVHILLPSALWSIMLSWPPLLSLLSFTAFPEFSTSVSFSTLIHSTGHFLSPSREVPSPLHHSNKYTLILTITVKMQNCSTSKIASSHSPLSCCHLCFPVDVTSHWDFSVRLLIKTFTDPSRLSLSFLLPPGPTSKWTHFYLLNIWILVRFTWN